MMMDRGRFNRRLGWTVCCFGAVLILALAAHARLAGPERERTLADAGFAWTTGLFYPDRACILDSSGRKLAWSERHFDLIWRGRTPVPPGLLAAVEAVAGCQLSSGRVLYRDVPVETIMRLEPLVTRHSNLAIVSRPVRLTAGPPELRQIIGQVEVQNGVQRGMSGLEATLDRDLAGRPGQYRVMRDGHGKWIAGTWQMLTDPVPATDIRTALVLPEEQP